MSTAAPAAFFSYSREDSEFALRLAEDLRSAGASVWIDQLDIEAGQEWDNAIEDALTRAPRMLLILSPSSVKSKNVRNEISFALDEQKSIVPVLYRDCMVPLQLHRIQYIDFRTDYVRGLKALLKTLGIVHLPEQGAPGPPDVPKASQTGASDAEKRKRAADQARREKERGVDPKQAAGSGFPSKFRVWARVAIAVCAILIVASVWYWASRSPSSEQTAVMGANPPSSKQTAVMGTNPIPAQGIWLGYANETGPRNREAELRGRCGDFRRVPVPLGLGNRFIELCSQEGKACERVCDWEGRMFPCTAVSRGGERDGTRVALCR